MATSDVFEDALSRMERIGSEAGVDVLPDVLVNAGGVTVSYFERVQNRQGYAWTLEKVRTRLEEIMNGAFDATWDLMQKEECSARAAAYTVALRRIAEAVNAGGDRAFFQGEGG